MISLPLQLIHRSIIIQCVYFFSIIVLDASLTTGQAFISFFVLFGLYVNLFNSGLKKNLNNISQNSHVRYIKILT